MKEILEKHYWIFLSVIITFALVTRLFQVGRIQSYIFDEVYHAVTAKLILHQDSRAFEWWNPPPEKDTAVDWLHPPLAKYTQALGMATFGETPFGWRISAVIFGTFVIGMTALLAQELFESKSLSLLAALFAASDGLLLVQSRIAMNDIHVTFFILLTFWLYLKYRRKRTINFTAKPSLSSDPTKFRLFPRQRSKSEFIWLFLTSLSAGLAMASKWSGIFSLVVIWAFEALTLLGNLRLQLVYYLDQRLIKNRFKNKSATALNTVLLRIHTPDMWQVAVRTILGQLGKLLVYLCFLPGLIYIFSYMQMFLQGKSLVCEEDFVQQGSCYCVQTSSWWVTSLKTIIPSRTADWEKLEARGGCKQLISHFNELHHQIWWYQTNLKATHPYQSRPLQWFLDLRPVWMYVDYSPNSVSNIYAQGNPLLFWSGDLAIGFMLFSLISQLWSKKLKNLGAISFKDQNSTQLTKENGYQLAPPISRIWFLLIGYGMVWLPWEFSPRIMFFYHYTPAVPLLSILLAFSLVKLAHQPSEIEILGRKISLFQLIVGGISLSILITFMVFYPNWIGLKVPDWLGRIYFFLPSWK